MKILGRKIAIFDFTSGTPKPFGAATNCTLDVQGDVTELASFSSRAKAYIPGKYSWTLNVEALYDVAEDGSDFQTRLLKAQLAGTKLRMRMAESLNPPMLEPSNRVIEYEGDVYVTSFNISAGVSGYATASVQLQGTGELIIDRERLISI